MKMMAMGMTEAGGPEVVKWLEIDRPQIVRPHDVLIRVLAAGVNPADWQIRTFGPPDYAAAARGAAFTVFGLDGVGEVVAVGSDVTDWKAGDEVWYIDGGYGPHQGSYAPYKVIDGRYLARKPASLDAVTAAAMPVVLVTAWEALYDRVKLAAGQSVLIQGGAGGVGHMAVQLAALRGARVAATVSTDAKADIAASLGAEHIIRYRNEDVAASLRAWSGKDGADVVFDTIGSEVFKSSFALVAPFGTLVSCVVAEWPAGNTELHEFRNITITFENEGWPQVMDDHQARLAQTAILARGAELVDAGKLRVNLDRVFLLEEAAEAQRVVQAGEFTGRVVIDMRAKGRGENG